MKTIFNKDGDKRFSEVLGFTYDFDYADIHTYVLTAIDDVCNYIGCEVYESIQAYYWDTYEEGGEGNLDELIKLFQYTLAYCAYIKFAPNNDVAHHGSGRKVLIDSDTEKSPYEWQVEGSNKSLGQQYYSFLDKLVVFLEKNKEIEGFEAWKTEREKFNSKLLYISNSKMFDQYFSVNNSGIFYYRTKTFQQEIEMEIIIPLVGSDLFETIKESRDENKELAYYIGKCIAYNTVLKAVKMFSIETLPEGLYKNLKSPFQTQNGKNAASLDEQTRYLNDLRESQDKYQSKISDLVTKLNEPEHEPKEVVSLRNCRNGARIG